MHALLRAIGVLALIAGLGFMGNGFRFFAYPGERFMMVYYGAGMAVSQRRRCGALGHGTHARLRTGAAAACLRGAVGLVSSATLRRSASMRLITRCGGAKVRLRS